MTLAVLVAGPIIGLVMSRYLKLTRKAAQGAMAETSSLSFLASNITVNPVYASIAANYALLLDNIVLTNVTDGIVLFSDDFDGENLQYEPPGCGGGLKVEPATPIVTDIVAPPPCSDANALAFLAAAGITNPLIVSAVCTLVGGLKSAGVWTLLDFFYPFVGGTSNSCSYNLVNPANYQITWHGGMTFADSGITGNGTSGYGDTHYNPAVNGVHLTLNSCHLGCYCRDTAPPASYFISGADFALNVLQIGTGIISSNTFAFADINDFDAVGQAQLVIGSGDGTTIGVRGDGANQTVYGPSGASATAATASIEAIAICFENLQLFLDFLKQQLVY